MTLHRILAGFLGLLPLAPEAESIFTMKISGSQRHFCCGEDVGNRPDEPILQPHET